MPPKAKDKAREPPRDASANPSPYLSRPSSIQMLSIPRPPDLPTGRKLKSYAYGAPPWDHSPTKFLPRGVTLPTATASAASANLGGAVQGAVKTKRVERQAEATTPRTELSRSRHQGDEAEDELAGSEPATDPVVPTSRSKPQAKPKRRPGRPRKSSFAENEQVPPTPITTGQQTAPIMPPTPQPHQDNGDTSKTFSIESGVYGNASIGSTPGSTPHSSARRSTRSRTANPFASAPGPTEDEMPDTPAPRRVEAVPPGMQARIPRTTPAGPPESERNLGPLDHDIRGFEVGPWGPESTQEAPLPLNRRPRFGKPVPDLNQNTIPEQPTTKVPAKQPVWDEHETGHASRGFPEHDIRPQGTSLSLAGYGKSPQKKSSGPTRDETELIKRSAGLGQVETEPQGRPLRHDAQTSQLPGTSSGLDRHDSGPRRRKFTPSPDDDTAGPQETDALLHKSQSGQRFRDMIFNQGQNTTRQSGFTGEAAGTVRQEQKHLTQEDPRPSRTGKTTKTSQNQAQKTVRNPLKKGREQDTLPGPDSSAKSTKSAKGFFSVPFNFSNRASLFAREKEPSALESPFPSSQHYPSDHSERDAAIQRDIELAEEKVVREALATEAKEMWRRRRMREAEERRERWRLWWEDSFSWFQPVEAMQAVASSTLWRLLDPRTYFWAIFSFLDGLMDRVYMIDLMQALASFFKVLPWLVFGLSLLVLTVLGAQNALTHFPTSVPDFGLWPFAGGISWPISGGISLPRLPGVSWPLSGGVPWVPSVGSMGEMVGDYMPSFSWPSRSPKVDLSELWEQDDSGNMREEIVTKYMHGPKGIVTQYNAEYVAVKKSGTLSQAAMDKLKSIVPKLVHMELHKGKPVIGESFWHALRDLIRADDSIFRFKEKKGGLEVSSERQWQAIASRLVGDATFTSKLNMTVSEAESRIADKMSNTWDAWIRDNENKIAQSLDSALAQMKSTMSEEEFERHLGKAVKEQQKDQGWDSTVISRDEFLRHLKNEFAVHRSEIRAELNELQPRLEKLIKESVEMAMGETPQSMTRADIQMLVDGLVRKAIADMNIAAMANGKIHVHLDTDLKNQTNYFALGAGATIDATHTSATYDPMKLGIIGDKAFLKGLRSVRPLPPLAALDHWEDVGECWCAARAVNKRGNPHGASISVQLAHQIIPEHIVLEHILPGATLEPNARPRDVEIYGVFSDMTLRERMRDFAATHYPVDEKDWNSTPAELPESFVQIGRFTYEGDALHDGRYVHRLNPELKALGAETDQVVVRAVSNFGAKEHTCFYRVRLYGLRLEREE